MLDFLLPYLQQTDYAILWFLADAMYALNDLWLCAARITLILRNVLPNAGATVLGHVFEAMGPIWTVALFAALVGAAVMMAGRFLFTTQLTTVERFIVVTLLAGYLMANGTIAVQWYNFFRKGLGRITYQAAYDAIQSSGANIVPDGPPVEPNCGLSQDDPERDLCTGYEFALSYQGFSDESQIFTFRMSPQFQQQYFPVRVADFPAQPAMVRQALLDAALPTSLIAGSGLPLSIMALIEELTRLVLGLATIALFSGLAVALIFGAFIPIGDILTRVLERLVQLLVATAVVELVMGLFGGFLWLAQVNAALYLGVGLLALIVDLVMLFQSSALALRAVDYAMHGTVRLNRPEQLAVGGFEQLGRAAAAVAPAPQAVAHGGYHVVQGAAYGAAMAVALPIQAAMNLAQPLVAGAQGGGAAQGQSGGGIRLSGGQVAGSAQQAAQPATQAGSGQAAGGGAQSTAQPATQPGAQTAGVSAGQGGTPAAPTASQPAAAPATGTPQTGAQPAGGTAATPGAPSHNATTAVPHAMPVMPVYDTATGLVHDPATGSVTTLGSYARAEDDAGASPISDGGAT
jgi:hypothetical protein